MDYKNQNIPEYVNVSMMVKMLGLSRSRLYQLVEQGILLKPIIPDNSKRPLYSREMIIRNLEAKRNSVGINGTIIMFYAQRSQPNTKTIAKLPKKSPKNQPVQNGHKALIDDLDSLGLPGISSTNVESALSECFPNGTANVAEDEILT